jgi:hypothetical protein
MGINPRTKGSKGELEFISRYQPFFNEPLKRNLLQTREGGSDITGCHPWVIEVKRCQQIEHNKWWKQVSMAVLDPSVEMPIVAYRQNNCKWNFQLPASFLDPSIQGYVVASEDIWLALVLGAKA